ncbi:MAG: hypothetical protein WD114_05855, partial [Phycisphaerales bacterium]
EGLTVRRSLQPVWTALLVIAFVLFVLDLAMRRVAFDRWVAQAREETLAVTREARTDQMRAAFASRQQARAGAEPVPEMDRSAKPRTKASVTDAVGEPERRDEVSESDNPLLAAKRRARSKMENE